MAKFILEEEILFTNKKIFKDSEEHCYTCKCYDGVAVCEPTYEDELPMLIATYPKKADVRKDKELCRSILEYRGLWDLTASQITFGDIMLKMGKLTKVTDEAILTALKELSK